jgi:hypothetical protein
MLFLSAACDSGGFGRSAVAPPERSFEDVEHLSDELGLAEGEEAPPAADVLQAERAIGAEFADAVVVFDAAAQNRILSLYEHLDRTGIIHPDLRRRAILYFDANKAKFRNQRVITIIDYGRPSPDRRLFVIDVASGTVTPFRVAHGKGSDLNHDGYAEAFGNDSGSHMSSLGFARTAETYVGRYGRSLRLDGLDATNSNLRRRSVVIHGSNYVHDRPVVQGRSLGCPAVPMGQKEMLINLVAGGSLVYAADSRMFRR